MHANAASLPECQSSSFCLQANSKDQPRFKKKFFKTIATGNAKNIIGWRKVIFEKNKNQIHFHTATKNNLNFAPQNIRENCTIVNPTL